MDGRWEMRKSINIYEGLAPPEGKSRRHINHFLQIKDFQALNRTSQIMIVSVGVAFNNIDPRFENLGAPSDKDGYYIS